LKERFVKEWSQIPSGIRERQRRGKHGQVKKFIRNRIGQAVKKLLNYTEDFSVVWVLEDLTGLKDVKGPYSKFAYRKFAEILRTKVFDVMSVSPAYTSLTCWKCDGKVEINGRTAYCKQCYLRGFHRDLNAAINIAKRGICQYFYLKTTLKKPLNFKRLKTS
jgi:IS605 OrfB family transposase